MIAALYVETNGCYFGFDGVDPWDEARDARQYAGPWPVVAHPPCARWCQLAGLVQHRYPHLREGEDGGTFAAALEAVRTWGGVLEHPAYSKAWNAYRLPWPSPYGWQRGICGGWVTQIEQAHYGHRAHKATWLYAYGVDLPSMIWGKAEDVQLWLSWTGNRNDRRGGTMQRMCKSERSRTPPAFRDLLISIARTAEKRVAA